MKTMTATRIGLSALCLSFCLILAQGQEIASVPDSTQTIEKTVEKKAVETNSIFNTFLRDDILHFKIKTRLREVIRKKDKEERYPSVLTYQDQDGNEITRDIELRARGNMRKRICYVPPLKIYFPKKELEAQGFNKKYNDFKLVVNCKTSDVYEDYVMREYLIYKMYNILTDMSYRVQLVNLTLEDVDGKQKDIETYAFLIENDDELAARLKGKILEPKGIVARAIDPGVFDRMAVFQYMVLNTDWYVYNRHNLKVLKAEGYDYPVVVPYDFDYAGIVETPYAVPNEKLPLETVKEPFFLGLCRSEEEYEPTLQLFRDKKEEILQVCQDFSHINDKSRKTILHYLDNFFEVLENPKLVKSKIIEHCDRHIKIE